MKDIPDCLVRAYMLYVLYLVITRGLMDQNIFSIKTAVYLFAKILNSSYIQENLNAEIFSEYLGAVPIFHAEITLGFV